MATAGVEWSWLHILLIHDLERVNISHMRHVSEETRKREEFSMIAYLDRHAGVNTINLPEWRRAGTGHRGSNTAESGWWGQQRIRESRHSGVTKLIVHRQRGRINPCTCRQVHNYSVFVAGSHSCSLSGYFNFFKSKPPEIVAGRESCTADDWSNLCC